MKRAMRRGIERLGKMLYQRDDPQDLKAELQRQATAKTAEYIHRHMRSIQSVSDQLAVHDEAIKHVSIPEGLVCEFGVYEGRTINYIASRNNWTVDGFDSFEGLPETWRDGYDRGAFAVMSMPTVRSNVRLHRGWFDESIPQYLDGLRDRRTPVAYLHVDCDLYTSTKSVLDLLSDNIVPGTVIVFDEYFYYPGWEVGEFLAFQEAVSARSLRYRYITYNARHEQVAVVMV